TQIIELPMAKRAKNDSEAGILKYRNLEGDSILTQLKQNEVLIALEVGGREFSTEKLAETMKTWMLEGNDVALAIGGPDGH
ncbi:23S rRNA (pseudouridine(1915)-N(3))-methyltransferase RlmH, partial [Klebsiella pneumoniae]|nr:23S rRNA (pseudouridine(1915)-N(3))-methyltransferase RlmH [Klebsiella pneumoniae]